MWFAIFILGLVAALVLCITINLELNALSKTIDTFILEIKKHYGLE
jgi:hypothetical protein